MLEQVRDAFSLERSPIQLQGVKNANVSNGERLLSAIVGTLLTVQGMRQRNARGAILAASGLGLLVRGVGGYCPMYRALNVTSRSSANETNRHPASSGILVQQAITVERPPQEVYAFWRNFSNLPQFMEHLESVTIHSDTLSRWVARAPAGVTAEWEARIVEDIPGHHIAWESTENASLPNRGAVAFTSTADGKATEVRVSFRYEPPAGKMGDLMARLFGSAPRQKVAQDLRRLKQILEIGHTITTEGQPRAKSTISGLAGWLYGQGSERVLEAMQ